MAKANSGGVVGPGGTPIKTMGENHDINTAIQLWVGRPKIGKTSTAAALGTLSKKYDLGIRPFFLLFEQGSGGVELDGTSKPCSACKGTGKSGKSKCPQCLGDGVVRLILSSMKETEEWFNWFAQSSYTLGVIDTGDAMFQAVTDAVCVENKVVSPVGAGDHGATWYMIADKMRELLAIPIAAGKGLIIIMHVYMQERRVGGGTIHTSTFNVSGKSRQNLSGMANQILHFDVVPMREGGDKHVLFAAPQAGVEAGDQWGLFPPQMDLGKSPEEAAEAILTAFGYLEKE